MRVGKITISILCFLLSIIMLGSFNNIAAQQKNSGTHTFESIYPYALRGEMNKVLSLLDIINVDSLNESQLEVKRKLFLRFRSQNEQYSFNTEDAQVKELVNLFHEYWKAVMLEKQSLVVADSLFEEAVANFLFEKHFHSASDIKRDEIKDDLYMYGNRFFKEKGLYSNAFGKTGHLYDLFLWKENELHNYKVDLIENSVEVEVHFMKDFISTGWAHYATLGRSYSGGWATNEALYVVDTAYDKESEWFKVSYLAHEGQHFADYKHYPKLEQPDLEYRAKLVELNKSESTTLRILRRFIRNAADQKSNAHAYANHVLIQYLSEEIFGHSFQEDIERWKEVSPTLIKQKALHLYEEHTEQLKTMGSKNVTELITLSSL